MTRCSKVTDKDGNDVSFSDKAGSNISGWTIVGGRNYCEVFEGFSDLASFLLEKPFSDSFGISEKITSQLTITVVEGDSLSLTDRGFESINFAESDDLAVNAKETLIKAGYGYGGYGRIGYGGKQTRAG
jgi:hypothetical protein